MRIFSIVGVLYLLMFYGCDRTEECQLSDAAYFRLHSLDMKFDELGGYPEFDAILVEMPFTGTSGYFVLRDEEGDNYRFEPWRDMDWEDQLGGLELGKTYHFVFSPFSDRDISGIKILDGEALLYLAASSTSMIPPAFFEGGPFRDTELEGLTVEQLSESKCEPKREVQGGHVSLVTNLPMLFQYGEQSVTLYQTQEATFVTSHGEFLVHVSDSVHVEPQNYDDGGYSYSYYVKRLLR